MSRGWPTRGGLPAWGLGEMLITPNRKNVSCYEPFTRISLGPKRILEYDPNNGKGA